MTPTSYHAGIPAVKPGLPVQAAPGQPSQSPRIAEGPFVLAGEIRPGAFVYLYHRPDPTVDSGFELEPAYYLHVTGNNPLTCTCWDKRVTHAYEPRYICKHMRALALDLAPTSPGFASAGEVN